MSYTVTFENYSKSFSVDKDELILDAAVRQGINFPYTCSKGFCGACKGELLSGDIEYKKDPKKLEKLDSSEKTDITTLFCSCVAKSDLHIDIEIIDELEGIDVDTYPAKIIDLTTLAPDVLLIKLKIPENIKMNFIPGQYIDILMDDGKKRSFSLANAVYDNELLQLHIRLVEDGYLTPQLFKDYKVGDILRIDGPHGAFFYKKGKNKPLIFIAGGTGFAPVKSIVEQLIHDNSSLPINIYWGARDSIDLYLSELADSWDKSNTNIKFIPVLSQCSDDNWSGKKGYVHQTVCDDFKSLAEYDIYACGPPIMIESAQTAFKEKGLKLDNFYYDSFDYAED